MSGFSVLRHLNLRGVTYALVANPDCVAALEDGSTASQAYKTGEYILRNDVLYDVIKDINPGGAFIDSTASSNRNISPTDVGTELTKLKSSIDRAIDISETNLNNAIAALDATKDTGNATTGNYIQKITVTEADGKITNVTKTTNTPVKLNNTPVTGVNFSLSGSTLTITTY